VRVVLAVTALTFVLGMVQKSPCVANDWASSDVRYAAMCYSDAPYLYAPRGFAAGYRPYTDTQGRYQALEYPVLIGYFAYGTARLTQALGDPPDLAARADLTEADIYGAPGVMAESSRFFVVTAVLLAPFALLSAWFLAGVHRRRPWDAMLFAASPALLLAGLVNWDLLAVCALTGALWAWSRGQPVLCGVLVGLGTATKLYPVFLLGALLVVCIRRGRLPAFAVVTGSAVIGWLLVNAPPMLADFDQWKVFWTFNNDRGAGPRQHRLAGVLRSGLRRRAGARSAGAPHPPDPAVGLPDRGRVPAGQQGLLPAVRPVAATTRGAGPAPVARRAGLDGR
jgi:uncharacterized membrane protein